MMDMQSTIPLQIFKSKLREFLDSVIIQSASY